MSALAILCRQKGIEVAGSDVAEDFVTKDVLAEQNIKINNGFDGRNINKYFELIVVSAAYGDANPEVREAKRKKIPMITYSEMLAALLEEKKLIAVSGTHGKTTITALIAYLLEEGGIHPGWLIGAGDVKNLSGNAKWGESDYFVAEADEYKKSEKNKTAKFLDFKPEILIISSIEMDHPDIYRDIEEVYNAFYSLAARVKRSGVIIANTDNQKTKKLTLRFADRRIESYGFEDGAKWQIKKESDQIFNIEKEGKVFGPFQINLFGDHNILNATAAIIASLEAGLSIEKIKELLPKFLGVKRRMDFLGEKNGLLFYDDYAHHPTEVKAALKAVKEKNPDKKIWAVFQPHTYSRTKSLLNDFAESFENVDYVLITEIFTSAREEKDPNFSGRNLAIAISRNHQSAKFVNNLDEATDFLKRFAQKGEIVVLMGAGDVYKIFEKM